MVKSAEESNKMKSALKLVEDELFVLRRQVTQEEHAKAVQEQGLEASNQERDAQRAAVRRLKHQQRALQTQLGTLEGEKKVLLTQVNIAAQQNKDFEGRVGKQMND